VIILRPTVTDDSNTPEETAAEGSIPPASDAPAQPATAEGDAEDGEVEIAEVDPVEAAEAETAAMKEKLMRTAADFDNYRKRSRREVSDAEKKGRDGLLKDLLPVFDNLERATAHAGTASTDDGEGIKGLVDGITLVMKQFTDALGRLGIERVESIGQPFDPSVHEAIQHLETNEYEPGCVAAEVQPGYKHGDRLVRPALVVVAKAAPAPEPNSEESSEETAAEDTSVSEESN